MAPQRRVKRVSMDQLSLVAFDDRTSVDSKELATQTFFGKKQQAPAPISKQVPSHSSSVTWKSQAIKDKEEYERVKQRVRHFAPELFKASATPGPGSPAIFPQNVGEWVTHKKEILALAEAEQKKNCEMLKAQIEARQKIPKSQRKIKSVFGENGKIFNDGLSPVLGFPTIWSAEYLGQVARWPSNGELQWNGDNRQNLLAKTKCGRFLPPPRAPATPSAPFQEQPFLKQLPLDEAGPIFCMGPRPDEIFVSNADMDSDPQFEALGSFLLGTELMQEVGQWRPPVIPLWPQEQLLMGEGPMVPYQGDGFVGTPAIGSEMLYNESMQAMHAEMWHNECMEPELWQDPMWM
ncbi:uncharacterized protein Z520_08034 [Fonsecaea multimorphosa CBS 102226]|uniref:Uncharacterized protein n=1 Tax=Fonsecaea multimorphosa CBS 102226 TaxID=1442371 RepID=A0A0D2IGS3_9EURO|nr:uncharacterized protein Z520_08034 [Fonsecaea multimorphosa CBS 102226]KIX96256.1 hypothetical protein Z520_08034 [Fonsecaea multimorphosa CBS 102226]OAL21919.1 hypothetical protein AYO22_07516 [Fonsecaea multimorphosa]